MVEVLTVVVVVTVVDGGSGGGGPEVAVLHPTGDEGHGDVPLHPVHAGPGRHQRQDPAGDHHQHLQHHLRV